MATPTTPMAWGEVRRLDLNAAELGIPVQRLMDRAGKALAGEAHRMLHGRKGRTGPIVVLCGKGNNGGDGFAAAARLLATGRDVQVVLVTSSPRTRPAGPGDAADPVGGPGRQWAAKIPADRFHLWPHVPRGRPALVLDCLLGSGGRGAPRAPFDAAIRRVNSWARQGVPVLSCDLPSGLGSPIAVKPTATVTFHAPKLAMDASNSGRVLVAPIGIPRAAVDGIGLGDLEAGFIRPAWDSHKGQNGIVIAVAGCLPYTGAPYYCALGAYRSGADLVHAIVPGDAANAVRAYGPQAIVHSAGPGPVLGEMCLGVLDGLLEAVARRPAALLVGPGLGRHPQTLDALHQVLQLGAAQGIPMVVDADGLDAVTPDLLRSHGHHIVLTPHAQEFRDLSGREPSVRNVTAYARRHGVTVLRKAAVATVSDGQRTRHCLRGHPTLTVGGTGDVLAGATAALLAKGAPTFEAACAATYLVKCAGEVAASMLSYGATATEVADAIPAVLLRLDA